MTTLTPTSSHFSSADRVRPAGEADRAKAREMGTKEELRRFITTNYYAPDPEQLTDDASLLDLGIIDSTGVLELIAFLEDTYGIAMADDEVVPDNLDTIKKLSEFVERRRR